MRYNKISMVGFAHNREEIESMANEKILVVDDDKNICELLRLYLVKEGYNVTMAHDGAAALTEFDKLHPDLVLLDVMMPVMDGWETCRKLRAKSSTPIIMLTAKGETYDKVLGLELGADDYIVKPFDAKEVTARIKAVLRRTAAKDEGKPHTSSSSWSRVYTRLGWEARQLSSSSSLGGASTTLPLTRSS